MLKNYQSKYNLFSEDEGYAEYKAIDYNSVLFQTIIDIKSMIPRVRANLIQSPSGAAVLLSSVETLWILSKHYARKEQQNTIDQEFENLDSKAFAVYGKQHGADLFFRRTLRLFDAVMQVLRENDKLEHLTLHGSLR